jgi:hypothetical protein
MLSQSLTMEQRRALQIIEGAPNGCTEPAMQALGFPVSMMIGLVGAGLVSARPYVMKVGRRSFGVVRLRSPMLAGERLSA